LNVTTSKPALIGLAAAILAILLFPLSYPAVDAQNAITFTTQDRFNIPDLHGSIRFALNGSYSSATLENGTWNFNDLSLNGSQFLGNLKISADNSDLLIWSFRPFNFFGSRSAQLRYNVQGAGTQVVNLCLNTTQSTHAIEWTVTVPGGPGTTFLAEGDHWNLLADNTVIVSGLTGNVSVSHYQFNISNDSNLPIYQRHSLIIVTAILIAVVVAVALVIHFRMRS
jgi:hypothetical protein